MPDWQGSTLLEAAILPRGRRAQRRRFQDSLSRRTVVARHENARKFPKLSLPHPVRGALGTTRPSRRYSLGIGIKRFG
jgi:hypothetical protein